MDVPAPAIEKAWQVSTAISGGLRGPVLPGQLVTIGLRNKFGVPGETYNISANVIAPNGVALSAARVLTADTWSYFVYPYEFVGGRPISDPGTYTVLWEVRNGFLACDGFVVVAEAQSAARPSTPLAEGTPARTAVSVATASSTLIRSCIENDFNGWSGETVFELCNGQLWEQAEYDYLYRYAYRPKVTITGSGGRFLMIVDGVNKPLAVVPVSTFVKSCINGEFEGWKGQTVFPLCNGQVWQQSSYSYRYHYAHRPAVFIYLSEISGGYKMQVEGVEDTLPVRQLR